MRLFGLTGGIGMGKSTCATLLADRGIRVVDTDDLAHSLTAPGRPALQEISQHFGRHVLDGAGQLDRSALARIVFNDAAARATLESILHPRIQAAWQATVSGWRQEGEALGVVVIPLLFETGAASQFAATVCVACSKASQQERLEQRGWTHADCARRIAAQLPIEDKLARSDYLVWSEGDPSVLPPQLARIFRVSP